MKHIRITVRPDLEDSPRFLQYLLDADAVGEARALDWNRGDAERSTHLYGIDGDGTRFADLARETSGVDTVELSAADERVSYALVTLRDAEVPIFGGSATAIDRAGLVVQRPLVYRDGCIRGHIVGDPGTLQTTLDELPEHVRVRVDAIQQFPSAEVSPATTLTDRQQEALRTALEMGYFDTPRGATQADVADELGCAANTASEHLRKGAAKLVEAGLTGFSSSR
jgi:predicted DNA binding protein